MEKKIKPEEMTEVLAGEVKVRVYKMGDINLIL